MYKKLIQIAAMLILLAGAANSAVFAQEAKPASIVGAFFYNGVETSPGVFEQMGSTHYGNTFVLDSTGEWENRHLTVSLNYYASLPNGGTSLTITGGSWSMVRYDLSGQYQGTLYGDVKSGTIKFMTDGNRNVLSKRASVQLESTGCLLPFFLSHGETIKGALEMTTNFDSVQTSGTLDFLTKLQR